MRRSTTMLLCAGVAGGVLASVVSKGSVLQGAVPLGIQAPARSTAVLRVDQVPAAVAEVAPAPMARAARPPRARSGESDRTAGRAPAERRPGSSGSEPSLVAVAPLAPPEPVAFDPEPRLVSTGKVTTIYRKPSKGSLTLGYLRAGAVVARAPEPTTRRGCAGGFYEISPDGYVCVGQTASTDVEHVMARVASRRADRDAALPYVYGIAPHESAPIYARIPSEAEQKQAEPDLGWHLGHPLGKGFEHYPIGDIPWFLAGGQPTISSHGYRMPRTQLVTRRTLARSGYAFVRLFESGGRRFGLTVDMQIIPLDRVNRVEGSRFHGIPLGGEVTLPVVFARGQKTGLYTGDPATTGLVLERFVGFREALPVTGRSARVGKHKYLEARDGRWVRDQNLVQVDAPPSWPAAAERGEKWIDVSIAAQSLVAYEGMRPVFVTLVSTGKDGAGDPETTHSTVQGEFRVHTKHVSVTMASDELGDEFELNDVPYVQYFTKGYALHAAYWHDGFGAPRSHGCVNLSPLDARWLFGWTDPPVPTAWHGAMSLARGTLVAIRN